MQISKPVRVERTYTQKIDATPDDVFPLLCPVREAEWAQGWAPTRVYSDSGFAEAGCVFLTRDRLGESVWMITRHEPQRRFLEMVKVIPGVTAGKITITLRENQERGTDAQITYAFTALGEAGERFVQDFTESYYAEFMRHWEAELNDYIRAGKTS